MRARHLHFNYRESGEVFSLDCSKRWFQVIFAGYSVEIEVLHLTIQGVLVFLTFLKLCYLYEALAGLFQILATPLLERFDAKFSAIFNDFDVTISNREVLTSSLVGELIFITLELSRGKTTDLSSGLLFLHQLKIVFINVVFFFLLDDQA